MRTTEIKQNDLGQWVYRTTSNYYWQAFPEWVKNKTDMNVFLKHENYFREIDSKIANKDMKAFIDCYDIYIPIPLNHALALNKGDYIMTEIKDTNDNLMELQVDFKWYCINNIDYDTMLVISCKSPSEEKYPDQEIQMPSDEEYKKAEKNNNYHGL